MEAVRMVLRGLSTTEVARHFGYSQGVIVKWVKRARFLPQNSHIIPTKSSRPHHHPHAIPPDLVSTILRYRRERNQCAEILHYRLLKDGYVISLSSVKRTLKRFGISRYSRWKKWHQYPDRPAAEKPGILVEIDTIHHGAHENRFYIYTMLDVYSRFAHAMPVVKINTHGSLRFVRTAPLPFKIQTLQSDHGPEFSKWFTTMVAVDGVMHRHSRVRRPNDNAHLERFNRTLQDECINRLPKNLKSWRKEIPEYLRYYNTERPHMGLHMKTPSQLLNLFQAID